NDGEGRGEGIGESLEKPAAAQLLPAKNWTHHLPASQTVFRRAWVPDVRGGERRGGGAGFRSQTRERNAQGRQGARGPDLHQDQGRGAGSHRRASIELLAAAVFGRTLLLEGAQAFQAIFRFEDQRIMALLLRQGLVDS